MTEAVTISCGGRLHLGFLDLNGGLGRRFGSLGMALDAPRTRLVLRRSADHGVHGPEATRAALYLRTMVDALGLPGAHALLMEEAMPAHSGLGSGTQLALAVATALRRLHGLAADPRGDAALLGRGARSGIGIALFTDGGVVLDGGRGATDAPPPLLARLPVPPDWRVLLLLDPARQGISGATERGAFAALPAMAPAQAGELCRLVVMQALPALADHDLAEFGAAVTRMQRIVGDYFAPAQGGRFTSPAVAAALDLLAGWGAHGVGQSSWGPTGFAFAADPDASEWLRRRLADALAMPLAMICRARNHGADIIETSHDT